MHRHPAINSYLLEDALELVLGLVDDRRVFEFDRQGADADEEGQGNFPGFLVLDGVMGLALGIGPAATGGALPDFTWIYFALAQFPVYLSPLLLTPLAFLFSTARNSREIADVVALVLGLLLYPLASTMNSGLDILVSGVTAGTIAYGVHRWRARA